MNYPAQWGLSRNEAAYLTALKSGRVATPETLGALHGGKVGAEAIRSAVARLRRRLDPLQVEIQTRAGIGWVMDRYARARLQTLITKAKK